MRFVVVFWFQRNQTNSSMPNYSDLTMLVISINVEKREENTEREDKIRMVFLEGLLMFQKEVIHLK